MQNIRFMKQNIIESCKKKKHKSNPRAHKQLEKTQGALIGEDNHFNTYASQPSTRSPHVISHWQSFFVSSQYLPISLIKVVMGVSHL
jgi:hypothetical protein